MQCQSQLEQLPRLLSFSRQALQVQLRPVEGLCKFVVVRGGLLWAAHLTFPRSCVM